MIEAYYAPRKPVPLARQAECLAFAAEEHGRGFWSYIARFSDVASFQMKGWPDGYKWFDLPEALLDAAGTMALVARYEAEIMAFLAMDPEARAAIVSHGPLVAALAQELARREAAAKAGGPKR